MLILLEDYTINDPVLACPDIVDANGNTHSDSGSHGVLVENLAAPGHVSDRFAEAIAHRPAGLPKNDCTARIELRDCSRFFASSGGRACGLLPLLRHVLRLHKRLPCSLSPRKRRHYCQGYGQEHLFHDFFLRNLVAATIDSSVPAQLEQARNAQLAAVLNSYLIPRVDAISLQSLKCATRLLCACVLIVLPAASQSPPTLRRSVHRVARNRACAGIVHCTQDRRNRFHISSSLIARNTLQAIFRTEAKFLRRKFRSKPAASSMASHPELHLTSFRANIASLRLVCIIKLRM